jgi:hypothetical protein
MMVREAIKRGEQAMVEEMRWKVQISELEGSKTIRKSET